MERFVSNAMSYVPGTPTGFGGRFALGDFCIYCNEVYEVIGVNGSGDLISIRKVKDPACIYNVQGISIRKTESADIES